MTLSLLCLILAFACFLAGAIGVMARINWLCAGLAFVVLATILGHVVIVLG